MVQHMAKSMSLIIALLQYLVVVAIAGGYLHGDVCLSVIKGK